MKITDKKLIQILKSGGIGVLPTDTLYGLVGLAMDKKNVARIYETRKRNPEKPCIILISKLEDLKLFRIRIGKFEKEFLQKYWPGEVSVILDCKQKKFEYLHRGTKSLAFRLPKNKNLQKLLSQVGPLLAPSANPEGLSPALNIKEAQKYFGGQVDFYVSVGKLDKKPSTLARIRNNRISILREGSVKIKS